MMGFTSRPKAMIAWPKLFTKRSPRRNKCQAPDVERKQLQ